MATPAPTPHPLDRVIASGRVSKLPAFTQDDVAAIDRARGRGVSWADIAAHFDIETKHPGQTAMHRYLRSKKLHGLT